MWMNEWEVRDQPDRFDAETHPNAERGARILLNLLVWVNNNSDGWPYWSKPTRAADRLMDLLRKTDAGCSGADVTAEELAYALRPIKSFLTKHGVDALTKEQIVDPDAAAKRAAEAHAAALAAAEVALHEEALAYARKHDPLDYSNVADALVDAYLAGAKR